MKIKLSIITILLVVMSGTVCAITLESVNTKGQVVSVPPSIQEHEQKYVLTTTFTSFNIDVMERFRTGSAVTPDSKTVYVMNYDPTISVIDATKNEFIKQIELSSVSPGSISGGIVVGNKLYAVGSVKVVIMDTLTEQIVNSIPQVFPSGGVAWGSAVASPTRDRVYTVYGDANTMLAIDTSTNQLVGSANIGSQNTGIGVSPSGDKIYTSEMFNGNLTIVNATDFSIIDRKPFKTNSGIIFYTTAVAVGQDGRVYVGYVNGNFDFSIAVLDSNGNLIDTIITPDWSTGLEISKDGKYLVTGNGNIIDINTKTVIADVITGIGEYQVDMSPDGLRAYVTNFNSNYVTVVEGFPLAIDIDIDPDVLNLVSNGKWITAYIEFPAGYDVNSINKSTVKLTTPSGDTVMVDPSAPETIGDYNSNDIPDRMVKFDLATLVGYLGGTITNSEVVLKITGNLMVGTPFEASDTIRVVNKE